MKVTKYVHVRGKGGLTAVLAPGDTVPSWATVTNPEVLEAEDSSGNEQAPKPAAKPAPAKKSPAKAAPASE